MTKRERAQVMERDGSVCGEDRRCDAGGSAAAGVMVINKLIDDAGERGRGQPAPHATQQGAATPGDRASEAAGNVAELHRVPVDRCDSEPTSSTFHLTAEEVAALRCCLGRVVETPGCDCHGCIAYRTVDKLTAAAEARR